MLSHWINFKIWRQKLKRGLEIKKCIFVYINRERVLTIEMELRIIDS